jgi:Tol biopolymer transport system component
MKKALVNAYLVIVLLVGCQSIPLKTSTQSTSSPTIMPTAKEVPTATNTPTTTNTPTVTHTPTLVPTPAGGGGKLILTLEKSQYLYRFADLPGDRNVFVADPDGSNLTPITQGPKDISNMATAVSPDGQQVLYGSAIGIYDRPLVILKDFNEFDLWVTDINGSAPIRLTSDNVRTYWEGSLWLSDGRIIFIGWDIEGVGLFQVNPDGSGLVRINKPTGIAPGEARILSLAPDNTGIYWVTGGYCVTNGLCGARYFWTSLDGKSQRQIWTGIKNAADDVEVSPNGKWIAFQKYTDQGDRSNGCYVATIEGGNAIKIGDECARKSSHISMINPWSPDSKYLVFQVAPDMQKKVWPLALYSPEDDTTTVLPDLQTAGCDNRKWLSEKQILLDNCTSTFYAGGSQPSPARIVDLNTQTVTILPQVGFCDEQLSPDVQRVFYFNCNNNDKTSPITYKILDLQTSSITSLFDSVLGPSENPGAVYVDPALWGDTR